MARAVVDFKQRYPDRVILLLSPADFQEVTGDDKEHNTMHNGDMNSPWALSRKYAENGQVAADGCAEECVIDAAAHLQTRKCVGGAELDLSAVLPAKFTFKGVGELLGQRLPGEEIRDAVEK